MPQATRRASAAPYFAEILSATVGAVAAAAGYAATDAVAAAAGKAAATHA